MGTSYKTGFPNHAPQSQSPPPPQQPFPGILTFSISQTPKGFFLRSSVPDQRHLGVDPDPDPAIFVIDLQDANKKLI